MRTSRATVQKVDMSAAMTAQPITLYLGWEIFLSRVFRDRIDKGLWLHWYHPADRNRERSLRYGHFIAPNQTLEEALHAVYQSIEAIVELESMEHVRSFTPSSDRLAPEWNAPEWQMMSVNA